MLQFLHWKAVHKKYKFVNTLKILFDKGKQTKKALDRFKKPEMRKSLQYFFDDASMPTELLPTISFDV